MLVIVGVVGGGGDVDGGVVGAGKVVMGLWMLSSVLRHVPRTTEARVAYASPLLRQW